MNTKEKGTYSFIIFKDGDDSYCAVCLNLNLVEWGDDPIQLIDSINEAAKSYIDGVVNKGLPDELLNRHAPQKYWNMALKGVNSVVKEPKTKKVRGGGYFSFESKPYNYGSFIPA